nr:hypothetical protein [uncultured Ruminococcus sp.]
MLSFLVSSSCTSCSSLPKSASMLTPSASASFGRISASGVPPRSHLETACVVDESIIANKQTFVYTTDAGVTMSNYTLIRT